MDGTGATRLTRQVLADQVLLCFEQHPKLVVELKPVCTRGMCPEPDLCQELLEFIGNRRNVADGKEKVMLYLHACC